MRPNDKHGLVSSFLCALEANAPSRKKMTLVGSADCKVAPLCRSEAAALLQLKVADVRPLYSTVDATAFLRGKLAAGGTPRTAEACADLLLYLVLHQQPHASARVVHFVFDVNTSSGPGRMHVLQMKRQEQQRRAQASRK